MIRIISRTIKGGEGIFRIISLFSKVAVKPLYPALRALIKISKNSARISLSTNQRAALIEDLRAELYRS